ncbi:hypothetical protein JCM18909_1639 [Cutibacterium acnes JCM 18909]|nr:hypothetical protein JCM18909_1639 [Cutibacterium acnes JCM 18909]
MGRSKTEGPGQTSQKNSGHHESTSDKQNLGNLNPNPTDDKKVIERRPRSSANRADSFSASPDKGLFGGSFAALTDALPGNVDEPGKHIEPAQPQQHHPAPELGSPQHHAYEPRPSYQPPDSVSFHHPESLRPEISRPEVEPATKPASRVPAPAPPIKKPQPRLLLSLRKPPQPLPRQKIARGSQFDDNRGGSAAISMTRESATTSLHEVPEYNGSCLSTSSLFAQQ